MFEQFPKLIAPIDNIATVVATLSGPITTNVNSRTVTGSANFIVETAVGSLLCTNEETPRIIGYVGQIINEHTLILEEKAKIALSNSSAKIKNFKSGYKQASNGFLYPENAQVKYIADFFRRIIVSDKYAKTASVYVPYTIEPGETPELVSYKFYETPFYHWIILLLNNIVNPREEWPISEEQLIKKITLQYPGKNLYDVYEYRNTETHYVEDYDVNKLAQNIIYPVTIYEYETEKNESKRSIKVLQPQFLDEFVTSYYNALNG